MSKSNGRRSGLTDSLRAWIRRRALACAAAATQRNSRRNLRSIGFEALESRAMFSATIGVTAHVLDHTNNTFSDVAITDGDTTPSRGDFTDFGQIGVSSAAGNTIVTRTFTIRNSGDTNLNLTGNPVISITGANASDFTVTTLPASSSVANGTPVTFTVSFDPSAAGVRSATVNIASDDPSHSVFDFTIAGVGLTTTTAVDGLQTATTVDGTGTGATTGTSMIVLYTGYLLNGNVFDAGTLPVTLGTTSLITGFTEALNGIKLNQSLTMVIPSAIGYGVDGFPPNIPANSTLIFEVTRVGFPALRVTGGTNLDQAITTGDATPSATDGTIFGPIVEGTSATHVFTLSNTGGSSLSIGDVTISGANANQFAVTQFDQASGTFTVKYSPTIGGAANASATVSIASNDPASPMTFAVSGSTRVAGATAAAMTVSGNGTVIAFNDTTPSAADFTDFGQMGVASGSGITTSTRRFSIANSGDADLTLSGAITITGANASDFTVTMAPPTGPIAKNEPVQFTVTFDPSAAGTRTATVTINSNDPTNPAFTFNVQGQGLTTTTLNDGLQFATTQAGQGVGSVALQSMVVKLKGYLLNGTVVDDSTASGQTPLTFTVGTGAVIAGLDEGLLGAQVGQKLTLILPTSLAFGAAGRAAATGVTAIPPNAVVVYEVEVVAIKTADLKLQGGPNLDVELTTGDTTPVFTDGTYFGTLAVGQTLTHTYKVSNSGDAQLSVGTITLSGANANQFEVTQIAIDPSNSFAIFTVKYKPTVAGIATATVVFPSNDPTTPFTFTVSGSTLPTVSMTTPDAVAFESATFGNTGQFVVTTDDVTALPFVGNLVISSPANATYAAAGTLLSYSSTTGIGTLTLPAGATSATINLTRTAGQAASAYSTNFTFVGTPGFDVSLSSTNGTLTYNAATGTGTLSTAIGVTAATINIVASPIARVVHFTVTGTATPAVDYTLTATGATLGFDAVTGLGTLTFPLGNTSATVNLKALTDATIEGNETAIFTLNTDSKYLLGSGTTGTVTIDDSRLFVSLSKTTFLETAGATASVGTVTRIGSLAGDLVVTLGSSDPTAATVPVSVTIPAGKTSATFPVTAVDDATVDGTQPITITATDAGGDYHSGTVSGGVLDDEKTTVSVTAFDASATEYGTDQTHDNAIYRVTRANVTPDALNVAFKVSGTAKRKTDYVLQVGGVTVLNNIVTIPAGQDHVDVTLVPIDDGTIELTETAIFTLGKGAGYNLPLSTDATATASLADNEGTVSLTATDAVATEGANGAVFHFVRTGSTDKSMTVNFKVTGTAKGGTDYVTLGKSITFPAGMAAMDMNVDTLADKLAEPQESIIVTLAKGSKVQYAIDPQALTATATIDDVAPVPFVGHLTVATPAGVAYTSTGSLLSYNAGTGIGTLTLPLDTTTAVIHVSRATAPDVYATSFTFTGTAGFTTALTCTGGTLTYNAQTGAGTLTLLTGVKTATINVTLTPLGVDLVCMSETHKVKPVKVHGNKSGFTINTLIKNQGPGNAGSFHVIILISRDRFVTNDDLIVGATTITSLKSGEVSKITGTIPAAALPAFADTAVGSYFVMILVDTKNDGTGDITETNENNNLHISALNDFVIIA